VQCVSSVYVSLSPYGILKLSNFLSLAKNVLSLQCYMIYQNLQVQFSYPSQTSTVTQSSHCKSHICRGPFQQNACCTSVCVAFVFYTLKSAVTYEDSHTISKMKMSFYNPVPGFCKSFSHASGRFINWWTSSNPKCWIMGSVLYCCVDCV
jgi:hypothetical protein